MQPGQKGVDRAPAPQEAGWLWLLDVQSDDAVALRIHVLNMLLPEGATLIAYAPDDLHQVVGPYEEAGLFDDGDLWLPTIVSQRVRIECWVPASALVNPQQAPQEPLFVLDRLQHVYRDPLKNDAPDAGEEGEEGGIAGAGCHNQIVCHPEWLDLGQSVAGIGTIGNNSIWCSGQLLRTEIDDETPYYLTAHHCLSTNFEARSSEIYWEYQASVCGGPPPALNSVPHSNVCTLVRTGAGSDFTLLMIEGPIPDDVEWASWSSVDASDGADVLCIHHPLGKQKRISFGDKASNPTCGGALTHIRSNWNDGVTQPGSSGSGLFRVDNGQLIGQLHCGSSDCGFVTNDSYGAFFVTYPLISDKLDEGDDDNREDNDTCAQAVLLDAGVYPNRIVKSTDADWYRIRVPAGRTMTATAKFKHAWGDIDLRLYGACGTPPIDSAVGGGNTETVTYTNNTGSLQNVRLRAYIVNDVRNSYKLTVTIEN
jgi:lysyl endopeptidase